jgi:hypothetical protein
LPVRLSLGGCCFQLGRTSTFLPPHFTRDRNHGTSVASDIGRRCTGLLSKARAMTEHPPGPPDDARQHARALRTGSISIDNMLNMKGAGNEGLSALQWPWLDR